MQLFYRQQKKKFQGKNLGKICHLLMLLDQLSIGQIDLNWLERLAKSGVFDDIRNCMKNRYFYGISLNIPKIKKVPSVKKYQ